MGYDLDNRALLGVKINVLMGRHAGFLTASAALARARPDDGPHLIYLPERAFKPAQFRKDVTRVMKKHGRCLVAVSEGIADVDGTPIAARFSKEKDSHGNVQLSGTGALGDVLANEIRSTTDFTRVRADTFGYLQRSFAGVVSPVDAREARDVGRMAVQFATTSHKNGSVAIKRKPGRKYRVYYARVPLKNVAKETRHMPKEFINRAGNDVTEAFIEYAKPLTGKLPKMGHFKRFPVPRIG